MRSGTGRKSANLKNWVILAAALPLIQAHSAKACYYHWAQGLEEPTGIWPTATNTTLSASAAASASAAISALTQADAENDSAVSAVLSNSLAASQVQSQSLAAVSTPTVDAYVNTWMLNTTGIKCKSTDTTINAAVSQINANVQQVRYTTSNVYIQASSIPDYNVGPFNGNPNVPANANATFEIPRVPAALGSTATHTATGLGSIGVLVNGVQIFNVSDSMQYNSSWHNNAGVVEAPSFDAAKAHPQQQGVYHNHENPTSLISELGGSSTKSVLLGYAIDGFPIYNDYAAVSDGGTILKMDSGYKLQYTNGQARPNGGPTVGSSVTVNGHPTTYSAGYFQEDYSYVANQTLPSGEFELDAFNGATVYTPEFPKGTYAYFATVDSTGAAAYPYLVGPQYNGTPDPNDLAGGTITVPADSSVFTGVPEPTSLSLIGIVMLPLIRRKRTRS